MKLTAGKRAVMFFHWLLSLLITAAFALYLLKPELATELYDKAKDLIGGTQMMIVAIALTAVYVILTIAQAFIIFRRHRGAEPAQQTTAYVPPVHTEPEITYPAYEPQREEAPIQQPEPEPQPEPIEHTEVGLESDPEIDIEPITLKLERTGQPDYTISEGGSYVEDAPAEAGQDVEMPEIGAEE